MLTSVLIIDDDRASVYLAKMLLEELAVAKEIITITEALLGLELIRKRCGGDQAT